MSKVNRLKYLNKYVVDGNTVYAVANPVGCKRERLAELLGEKVNFDKKYYTIIGVESFATEFVKKGQTIGLMVEPTKDNNITLNEFTELGWYYKPEKSLGNVTLRFEIPQFSRRIEKDQGYRYWNLYLRYFPDREMVKIDADVEGTRETFFEGRLTNVKQLREVMGYLNMNKIPNV